MIAPTARTHIGMLCVIGVAAIAVNSASYFLTGISPAYHQSSDATVHMVNWQEFTKNYSGNFKNDVLFQNYQEAPSGVLLADAALVRTSEFLHIDILDWSIIISAVSLALFLSGVYFLVFYSTKIPIIGLIISLVSILPVISLGLSSWGFFALGFVPKETSLGIGVWLTILYLRGASTNAKPKIAWFFALLGLSANFYPPAFFHYAVVLLTVEVIRGRALKKEHLLYGLIFLAASPLALYDIFIKASHFTPPVLAIIIDHYGTPLHSLSYLLVHYLRKQIIYTALVAALWYVYRHVLKKEYPPLIVLWYFIWCSTLVWSLVGVGIEVFAPLYMKYLISRISVWFYLASMIIVAYTGYELWFAKFRRSVWSTIVFSALLLLVLIGQTSILNVYSGLRNLGNTAADYKQYLSAVAQLHAVVPPDSLVLANPDTEANTLRTYGGVGTYVAAKDGLVSLFDGAAAEWWFVRYKEAEKVFAQKDFVAIEDYARAHDLSYYFFNMRDLQTGTSTLAKKIVLRTGQYGLIQFAPTQP